jgi:uroporphyrinogen-III synthase
MGTASGPLAGVGVLVTRPEPQALGLCERIRALGGNPFLFPTLEIADPEDLAPARALVQRLDSFRLAIFVSPNAVAKAMPLVRDYWPQLPVGLQVAAVGKGSAEALRRWGIAEVLCPAERGDSEALLALPALRQPAGAKVLIVRGQGGRELLAETLRAHGAEVDYAEVYRRVVPQADPQPLLQHWIRGEVQVVLVTSNEALTNLDRMLDALGRRWLRETPLITVSERAAALARELGFRLPATVAGGADDESLVACLQAWRAERASG